MLQASLSLGRVAGIPVGVHYSWFIIAALITLSLSAHFRDAHANWTTLLVWTTSVVTALLFFVTLLAHELSHAVVARAHGLPVRAITLFALGGVAQIEKESGSAKTEFAVAIVGPITSIAIGVVCIGVARSMGWTMQNGETGVVGSVLGWLGSINIVLAVFNLIPGYPLDGGRVLRSVLWGIYKDAERATRGAARTGQVVAGIFIALGLLQFFAGAGFGGLWLAFIGWFLLMAAQASYAQVTLVETLRGVRVRDVMASDCATVEPGLSVHDLVDDLLLRTGRRCVMVRSDGHLLGLVTTSEVRKVERDRWDEVTVADVMRPLATIHTVSPDTPVTEAFTTMARDDVNQLPVMSDGRLEGIISRGHILQLLQSRNELTR